MDVIAPYQNMVKISPTEKNTPYICSSDFDCLLIDLVCKIVIIVSSSFPMYTILFIFELPFVDKKIFDGV